MTTHHNRSMSLGMKAGIIGCIAALIAAVPIVWHWNVQLVGIINAPDDIRDIKVEMHKIDMKVSRIAEHEGVNTYISEEQTNISGVVMKSGKRDVTND